MPQLNGQPQGQPKLASVMQASGLSIDPMGSGASAVQPQPQQQPAPQQPFQPQAQPAQPQAQPQQQPDQPRLQPLPQQQVPAQPTTAEKDAILEAFIKSGYTVPPGLDGKSVLNQVFDQLDVANQLREEYLPHKDQFAEWAKQQKALQQPAQQGNALPAQPAAGPAALPAPAAGSPTPRLSATALSLQKQGLLNRNANGEWTVTDPGLASYAEEANQYEAQGKDIATQLVYNTGEFLQPHVQQISAQLLTPYEERLKALETQIAAEREQVSNAHVDSWIDQNATSLFVDGDQNQLSTYGQQYNSFAAQVEALAEQMGAKPSRLQLHENTLQMMKNAGVSPQAQPAAQPAQFQPQFQAPSPQQTFMQQAAATPPQSNHNRLIDHPAMQPNGSPPIAMGKGGRPSIKAEMARLGTLPVG